MHKENCYTGWTSRVLFELILAHMIVGRVGLQPYATPSGALATPVSSPYPCIVLAPAPLVGWRAAPKGAQPHYRCIRNILAINLPAFYVLYDNLGIEHAPILVVGKTLLQSWCLLLRPKVE